MTARLQMFFGQSERFELQPLNFYAENSWLAQFIAGHDPSFEEFTVLMLAIVPHVQPGFFSKLITAHFPEGGDFPEFGGVKAASHRGILPTGETAQFILADDDIKKRLEVQRILGNEHWFAQRHILWLETVSDGEPLMSGRLLIDPEIVERLTVGTVSKPRFSLDFPAEYVDTENGLGRPGAAPNTLRHIREIEPTFRIPITQNGHITEHNAHRAV